MWKIKGEEEQEDKKERGMNGLKRKKMKNQC
jgi:hypothetical protein